MARKKPGEVKYAKGEALQVLSHPQYCRTDHWRRVFAYVMKRDDFRCVLCGRPAKQVHHRSYAWKGVFEKEVKDCHALCQRCHEYFEHTVKPQQKAGQENYGWTMNDLEEDPDNIGTYRLKERNNS